MRVQERERLLDEVLIQLKRYLRSASGKSFESSIYEWRRIDELKIIIKEISKIIDEN